LQIAKQPNIFAIGGSCSTTPQIHVADWSLDHAATIVKSLKKIYEGGNSSFCFPSPTWHAISLLLGKKPSKYHPSDEFIIPLGRGFQVTMADYVFGVDPNAPTEEVTHTLQTIFSFPRSQFSNTGRLQASES